MMRRTVRDLLIGTAQLTALIPPERWFAAGGIVDVPVKPFAILRWIAPVPGAFSTAYANQLRVDVHDERGDYERIDAILGGPYKAGVSVYTVLSAAFAVTGADGYVAQADYINHSGDQEDPDYKSNYRFSSWQIIGRES
jgi:hypothetical protein